jgi:hypothetical protein
MKISFVVPTGNIVNEERDRFLTHAMGDCWHEDGGGKPVTMFALKGHICSRCGLFYTVTNDFSTLEDFLKLYEWARGEPGLADFVAEFRARDLVNEKRGPGARKRFADGLYRILTARGREREDA